MYNVIVVIVQKSVFVNSFDFCSIGLFAIKLSEKKRFRLFDDWSTLNVILNMETWFVQYEYYDALICVITWKIDDSRIWWSCGFLKESDFFSHLFLAHDYDDWPAFDEIRMQREMNKIRNFHLKFHSSDDLQWRHTATHFHTPKAEIRHTLTT